MFQSQSTPVYEARRGVILMIVLALLTLFAIVGLSFVLYATSAVKSSEIGRQGEFQNQNFPDIDPQLLASYFLGQLIYDTDDFNGISSALRGHSLARTMYGLNYTPNPINRTITVLSNSLPFNGTGRLHTSAPPSSGAQPGKTYFNNPYGVDDYNLINYTYFQNESFLRDPERLGGQPTLGRSSSNWRRFPGEMPGPYVGGFNAPYTYPDLNNMFLAAVKAGPLQDASGKVLAPPGAVIMPSFHRPWLFGSLTNIYDPVSNPTGNKNWNANAYGKYMTLRPRPFDMDPSFPYPEDEGGDVKNLVGSPGYFDGQFTHKMCNNDSIWMDLGFPVMVAPNGRKFKPLFAPLVMDLDNRVNVNVHGNIRGKDPQTGRWLHLSNQGWGPWEVNLNYVLSADSTEWTNLFTGTGAPTSNGTAAPTQYGRYGYKITNIPPEPVPHAHGPTTNATISNFPVPPFYSKIDFDGSKDDWNRSRTPWVPPTGVSDLIQLPQPQTQFSNFPTYPQTGYGDALKASNELLNHPLFYNVMAPSGDDRRFHSSNMEALLRYLETGSPALTSELFRLCPTNFNNDKTRGLVTTRSYDLDRPGVRPWLPDYSAAFPYTLDQTMAPYPVGKPIPFPTDPRTAKGEFAHDGRAADAALGRIDVNRPLPSYPTPDSTTHRIKNSDVSLFLAAQAARVQLAQDIYDRLRLVTTGTIVDPKTIGITPRARQQEFYALQWLAQLAVNIVDYIDEDDYSTPFQWYVDDQSHQNQPYYVYGTELPRVVINEAYAESRNDPADLPQNKAKTNYITNFWVELLNTFLQDNDRGDSGVARLQTLPSQGYPNGYAVYRLKIATAQPPSTTIRNPSNVLGEPDQEKVKLIIKDFIPANPQQNADQTINVIQPAMAASTYTGQRATNLNGFYVLGPSNPKWNAFEGVGGNPLSTLQVKDQQTTITGTTPSSMSYVTPVGQNPNGPPTAYGLFLQRLACPALPPAGPGIPYNPYITVDYMEVLQVNNAIQYTQTGQNQAYKPATSRVSYGRNQPYAADKSQQKAQNPKGRTPPESAEPLHTFFRHNGREPSAPVQPDSLTSPNTIKTPFDWLQHGDRQLISPMEILHVSAFKPHELTQQFFARPSVGPVPQAFQQRAANAIVDQRSRLYRVFEFLETGDRALGTANGARIPGRINVNTLWDGETLLALCDPQRSNNFSQVPNFKIYDPANPYSPTTLFGNMVKSRTPGLPLGKLDVVDRPFLGMAAPFSANEVQYPAPPAAPYLNGIGINDTLLRLNSAGASTGQPIFEVPRTASTPHPSQWDELLNKIYNNLTTRSNVFAVWLTVGFFEVKDDTTLPVKLGAEIGRAENRHTRHRIFAIIDRTNIRESAATPVFVKATSPANVPPSSTGLPYPNPTAVPVSVDALSGTYEGIPWQIAANTQLLVGVGLDSSTPPSSPALARLSHQEVVTVTDVNAAAGTFTARFSYPHPAGFLINLSSQPDSVYSQPGNPGPQTNYDPRQDTAVVRYLSIIE
jgi:hypothetical protein